MNISREILQKHDVKRTGCREGIINAIIHSEKPLSENEIRESLNGMFDRTTFYRSFKTLIENKIIHKIVVDQQMVKYALDKDLMQTPPHAHFYCTSCNSVTCLKDIGIHIPDLPIGFQIQESELIIKGYCKQCNK